MSKLDINVKNEEMQEMLDLIRAKHQNLSDVEIKHLYHLASSYGLDPNKNEIWAVKYGSSPATIFVGRDGLLGIGHKTGQLDGMETKVIVLTKEGEPKETDITYPGTKLIGAKCTVYRKDTSHDFTVSVRLDEYNSNKSNWRSMPETMIKKVAEAHALRRAFSIHGVYIPEEFDQANNTPQAKGYEIKDATKKKEKKRELVKELPGEDQTKIKDSFSEIIGELAKESGTTIENIIQEELDGKNVDDIYKDEAKPLYLKLKAKIKSIEKENKQTA